MSCESSRLVVLCTCPDEDTARRVARRLVGEALAACVNILPGVQSVYEWKGQVESDQELLLIIKTHASRFGALERAIVEEHPYELPEIISVPIQTGLSGYLQWIDQVTGAQQ